MVRKIDDHASFAGKPSRESVAPMGCKVKTMAQDVTNDYLKDYRDTEDKIAGTQKAMEKKISSNSANAEYRH
jgi:hypothetical protein